MCFFCRYGIEFKSFTALDGATLQGFVDRLLFHRRERQLAASSTETDHQPASEDELDQIEEGTLPTLPPIPHLGQVDDRPLISSQGEEAVAAKLRSTYAVQVQAQSDACHETTVEKKARGDKNKSSRGSKQVTPRHPGAASVKANKQPTTKEKATPQAKQATATRKEKSTTRKTTAVVGVSNVQLHFFLSHYAMAGLSKENWEELTTEIDYRRAVELCTKVPPSPNSDDRWSPVEIQKERLFGTLLNQIQAGEMRRILCICPRECTYKRGNVTMDNLRDVEVRCRYATCSWCALLDKRGSLISSAFELQLMLAHDLKRMRDAAAAKGPATDRALQALTDMIEECFHIGRTKFYQLVKVAEFVKICPGITNVRPVRKTTLFWAVFFQLGKLLQKIDTRCGKQFAHIYWMCQIESLAATQPDSLATWEKWVGAMRWNEVDEELAKIFKVEEIAGIFEAGTVVDFAVSSNN